jgi:hypothetical protein
MGGDILLLLSAVVFQVTGPLSVPSSIWAASFSVLCGRCPGRKHMP